MSNIVHQCCICGDMRVEVGGVAVWMKGTPGPDAQVSHGECRQCSRERFAETDPEFLDQMEAAWAAKDSELASVDKGI